MKLRVIFLLILIAFSGVYAKDPIKRGKSNFTTGKAYPQIDVSGYEELEFNSLSQSGDPLQYQNTSEYQKLPPSVKVYDGLRHRRLIDLEGQINEKLYVRYKIQQEPELPQETDIYVEYDKFSVYFGKYDASLTNGALFSLGKNIDGLHMDYIEKDWQLEGIYGEERSHERTFSFSGTGKRDYSLGQTNILEGTLKVRINGQDIGDGDYSVDYFEGKITFKNILSVTDLVDGSYEYLDPIEDFLPISSKIRLSGIQHRYKGYTEAKAEIITKNGTYVLTDKPQQEIIPVWEQLAINTTFNYVNNNLQVSVPGAGIQEVYLDLDGERAPFRSVNNRFEYNYPTNKKSRPQKIIYKTPEFVIIKDFSLDFLDVVVTAEVREQVTLDVWVTPDVATTENPQALPTLNQIVTESISYVTQDAVVVSSSIQTGYIVELPEGQIVFDSSYVVEQDRLNLAFTPTVPLNKVQARFKSDEIPLFESSGKYYLNFKLDEEFARKVNYFYLILSSTQNISYRIPFLVSNDPNKKDKVESVDLPNWGVKSFSEEIYVDGEKLKPGYDYKMYYTKGLVRFIKEIPRSSQVTINYIYQETKPGNDSLQGINSQGPYKLSNQPLVEGTVKVVLNGVLQLEGQDYKVDYMDGKISFSRPIKEIEAAKVDYEYYLVKQGQVAKKENFSISSYFVQEKAAGAETSAEQSKTLSGGDLTVTSSGTTTTINIPIDYLPIIKSSFRLFINNVATTNYTLSNYNGEVVITSNAYAASSLKVDFNYGKTAYAPKMSFVGNGSATIIIQDLQSNFPRPIVYASTVIEHRGAYAAYYVPLEYKKDYFIGYPADLITSSANAKGLANVRDNQDAWERGVITFITGNIATGYSLNSNFGNSDQFRLTYKISGADNPDPGDISHQTYGTKFNYSPVDYLDFGVEYNESDKLYQRTIARGEYPITTGNGTDGQQIQLLVSGNTNLEVVQDSERIYINDRLQTRDDDYSITYKGGLVRFKSGRILNATDYIRIEFEYYSSDVGNQQQIRERAKASKIDATVKLPKDTNVNLAYVTVDAKYDPVGNMPNLYTPGTEAKKVTITSKPLERLELSSAVESLSNRVGEYKDNQTQDRYKDTLNQQYQAKYGFNQNDTLTFAANRTDTKLPANEVNTGNFEIDSLAHDQQVGLNIGPDTFRTQTTLKNAEKYTGVLDKIDQTRVYNRNFDLQNTYRPLSDLSFLSKYARNSDDEFREIRLKNLSEYYSETIRYTPWTIDTSLELAAADYFKENSIDQNNYDNFNKSLGKDRKHVYNFTFRRPNELSDQLYEELYLHFDDSYSSLASDLTKQRPDIVRGDNLSFTIRPYDVISLGYDNHFSRSILENQNRNNYMNEDKYRFNRFYPFKYISGLRQDFLLVNKVEYSKKRNENRSNVYSGNSLGSYSTDFANGINHSYTVNPLDEMTIDLQFTDKNTERVMDEYFTTGLKETISTEPQNTYGFDLDYDIGDLGLLKGTTLTWARDFSDSKIHKIIDDQTASTVNRSRDDLVKINDDVRVNYSYFDAFSNKHSLANMEEFKRKTGEGTRYSFGNNNQLDARWDTPVTGLGLTYGLTKIYNVQFKHFSREDVSRVYVDRNYDDKLLRWDDTQKLMLDYTPLPELTLDASAYMRVISQQLRTTAGSAAGEIKSKAYEFGATYRPIPDFAARYGWKRNIFDLGYGEESKFTADYTPLKFELGQFKYHYENIFTFGKGTNDPEQETNLNELQGFVKTTVTDRNDIKTINTLTLQINKEIANVIVDNMQVDVNLTRLQLWDRQNPEFSYSLNAFYAKGTLNF